MKTIIVAVTAVLTLTGCFGTRAGVKCNALRAEFSAGVDACNECMDRLADHGDTGMCEPVCQQPGKLAPTALSACGERAAEIQKEATASEASK